MKVSQPLSAVNGWSSWRSSWRQRDNAIEEWLDADTLTRADLERNLADIRRINALLGWTTFTSRAVVGWMRRESATPSATPSAKQSARQPGEQSVRAWSLLDVASGSADIPIAIARAARRARLDLRVTATDRNAQIVAVARERAAATPNVRVERRDALALPYPAGAFDAALCTLALHHFAPEGPAGAGALLRELARVARRVFIFDVVRSPLAYAGVIALTRLGGMDAMTRHDGPASVRRAYSAEEARALATEAGLRGVEARVAFPFRLILTAEGTQPETQPETRAETPQGIEHPY